MIKIEVTAKLLNEEGSEAGINISNETKGTAEEILHESLAAVHSVTSVLRRNDPFILAMFLKALKDDTAILLGEEIPREDSKRTSKEKLLADLMSDAIIREGVN